MLSDMAGPACYAENSITRKRCGIRQPKILLLNVLSCEKGRGIMRQKCRI